MTPSMGLSAAVALPAIRRMAVVDARDLGPDGWGVCWEFVEPVGEALTRLTLAVDDPTGAELEFLAPEVQLIEFAAALRAPGVRWHLEAPRVTQDSLRSLEQVSLVAQRPRADGGALRLKIEGDFALSTPADMLRGPLTLFRQVITALGQ